MCDDDPVTPRASRTLRGMLASGVATFTALLSHVAAGAPAPGWVGIVVPLALATLVSIAVAGRRVALPRLAVAVVASQALFHTLFILGAGGSVSGGGHHVATGSLGYTAAPALHDHLGPAMWVLHSAAALVTIAALHRADRTLRAIAGARDRLGRWVRRVVGWEGVLPAAHRVLAPSPGLPTARPLPRVASRPAPRRGPPSLVV